MRLAGAVFAVILKYGGPGLFVLGVLDSSFLFAPWGNDLLIVAMTARHRSYGSMFYYAGMSAAGSILGCLILDLTMRPLGAKGLETHLPRRRLQRIRDQVERSAGRALAVASLAPPPFPFTFFVMAGAALQYPRKRLLLVVGIARLVRFMIVGSLALRYGQRILQWARNPVVQGLLIGLIVVCTVGSVVSVYGWIKRSKTAHVDSRA